MVKLRDNHFQPMQLCNQKPAKNNNWFLGYNLTPHAGSLAFWCLPQGIIKMYKDRRVAGLACRCWGKVMRQSSEPQGSHERAQRKHSSAAPTGSGVLLPEGALCIHLFASNRSLSAPACAAPYWSVVIEVSNSILWFYRPLPWKNHRWISLTSVVYWHHSPFDQSSTN